MARYRWRHTLSMLLWDGLRRHDGSCEITLRDLAKLMQCDLRTLERRKTVLVSIARRWDPEARVEVSKWHENSNVFFFQAWKVRRGLERVMMQPRELGR